MSAVPLKKIRLAAAAAGFALLAGCGTGTEAAPQPAGSGQAPVAVTSEGTAEDAAPSASAAADGIPASALLQPADVREAKAEPLEQGDFPHVRPLRPCGDKPYPSDETRSDAVAVKYVVESAEGEGSVPTVVAEFVGRHEAGGAAKQFDEIGAALKKCPGGLGEGQLKWSVVGNGVGGDESVLVRIDSKESYADEEPATVSRYAALARVDDAIVVVTDMGWENLGGSEKLVRDLIGKAAERAKAVG
ncbi:hypothetical protein [Actinoplanes sp. GCM10030250]|uniref:hypothetical protein n=1 Tax=Actinoplanes sp. GCM10030250 TaxID=3273376 RepID=UPI0036098DA6